jgi:rod shape-determining protein MreD
MKLIEHQGGLVIILTFIVGLMLTMIPWPEWARYIPPYWVVMILIYWVMALPQRIGVGIAWVVGLVLDVAVGSLLGQHALALSVVAFMTVYLHQRLRVFPLWQQAIVIFFFCVMYSVINLWVRGITGTAPALWTVLLPSFTTALLWPVVFVLLRYMRRSYQVA